MDAICEASDALWDDFQPEEAAWLLAALSNLNHRSPPHLLSNLAAKLAAGAGGLSPALHCLVVNAWAQLRRAGTLCCLDCIVSYLCSIVSPRFVGVPSQRCTAWWSTHGRSSGARILYFSFEP